MRDTLSPEPGMVAVAHPGDTIILAYRETIDAAFIDQIRNEIKTRLPEVKVCILDRLVSIIVVKGAADAD